MFRVLRFKYLLLILAGVIFLIAAVYFLFFGKKEINIKTFGKASISLENNNEAAFFGKSPISGLSCEKAKQRPLAIMLSGDEIVRPLAGLGEADLVIEMPVVENGITRYMAVFVCGSPEDIGSIRSARDDFISLALGFDAIFVHWGGSHFALDELKQGFLDNIDALQNPYDSFYRKEGISMPHDGFSSWERLSQAAKGLGYRMESRIEPYPHKNFEKDSFKPGSLTIYYPLIYQVRYDYNPETNSYFRFKNNTPQKDGLNDKIIEAKVVAVLKTQTKRLENDYNDVAVLGTGVLVLYQNGEIINGFWKKDSEKSRLLFLDEMDREIDLEPGQIWIQYLQEDQKSEWRE